MFVPLGSFIFYGSGESLSNSNADFAQQIVTLYTNTIGVWSYIIISTAFTVMFGTIMAIFNGYSRSLRRTTELLFAEKPNIMNNTRLITSLFLLGLAGGSLVIVFEFGDNLLGLVDFATVLSFIIASVIAILT